MVKLVLKDLPVLANETLENHYEDGATQDTQTNKFETEKVNLFLLFGSGTT